MDGKKEILELIEAYIEETLSPKERLEFEQRLKEDKELADTWKLNQEVDRALNPKKMEMANLFGDLSDEFTRDYKQKEKLSEKPLEKPSSKIRPIFILLLIGTIGLLVALFWWNTQGETAPSSEQIFAEAYEPYPISAAVRSTEDPLFSELEAAQVKYGDGEYSTAITSLNELLQDGNLEAENVLEAHFYMGLSHLGNNETEAAKQELEIVIQSQNHPFTQQTQWYLALIELKENNSVGAKKYLNNILEITEEGKYVKKAKSLLEQLSD